MDQSKEFAEFVEAARRFLGPSKPEKPWQVCTRTGYGENDTVYPIRECDTEEEARKWADSMHMAHHLEPTYTYGRKVSVRSYPNGAFARKNPRYVETEK